MSKPLTVSRLDYAPPLRAANWACGVLERYGALPDDPFNANQLLADGRKAAGLRDYGDEHFYGPFRRMVASASEAPLTPLARVVIRRVILEALVRRLRLTDHVLRHPFVKGVEINRPVFVLGFPRTGTTVLQNLICQHAARRALKFWELVNPVPVYEDPVWDARYRRVLAAFMIWVSNRFAPEQAVVHDVKVDTPEECWYLFTGSFMNLGYYLQSHLDSYGKWLLEQDMSPAYRQYKRHLQVLTAGQPWDLVLKCPEHLWFLDTLFREFPDACVVWTHRDPLECIGSYSSMTSILYRTLYGRINRPAIGWHLMERFQEGVNRAMEVRERFPGINERIIDVQFEDMKADKPGTIRRICDRFGLPFLNGVPANDWTRERRDGPDTHVYDASLYGITREEIDRRFGDYIERYNIPVRWR